MLFVCRHTNSVICNFWILFDSCLTKAFFCVILKRYVYAVIKIALFAIFGRSPHPLCVPTAGMATACPQPAVPFSIFCRGGGGAPFALFTYPFTLFTFHFPLLPFPFTAHLPNGSENSISLPTSHF